MAGRPRNEDIDQRIIDITRALIDRGGIDAVSIAKVAEQAGIGRPTVYRRYQNRTVLAHAVLAADLQTLNGATPVKSGPLIDRIMGSFTPFIEYYAAHPARSRALLRESLFNGGGEKTQLNQQSFGRAKALATLLMAAKGADELPPGADPLIATRIIMSAYLAGVIGGLNDLYPSVNAWKSALREVISYTLCLGDTQ